MLRSPPPHFRPDATYVPGYDARPTRTTAALAAQVARRHGLDIVDAWPMPALALDCFVMRTRKAAERAPARGRDRARSRGRVRATDDVFDVLGHNDPLYPLQPSASAWHLAEVHRIATGRNVRIAEIDTGVDLEQPDLRDRIELARNFAETPMTAEQHGTAVAGIIAARADDDIGIAGIAPNARLEVRRACREAPGHAQATCTTFALARALQFALEQRVQVLNLSLGGPRDRLLERLLDAALARHVVIVAAVDEDVPADAFPASHPGVIAVGTRLAATEVARRRVDRARARRADHVAGTALGPGRRQLICRGPRFRCGRIVARTRAHARRRPDPRRAAAGRDRGRDRSGSGGGGHVLGARADDQHLRVRIAVARAPGADRAR